MDKFNSSYIWFLTLTYSMIMVMANWFDARLISLVGLVTDAGTLIFPLTFLLSDLITEVYGYKYARRAIWCGFLFNLLFLMYGQIIVHLPSPSFATQNYVFDSLLIINTRILIASIISYFIAEPLNAWLIAKLKILFNGRYMGFRFVASTTIAAGVDSLLFTIIAFSNLYHLEQLIQLMLTMWLIKIIVEIIGLPVSIYLANKLKATEHIDVYDTDTNFNLFNLSTAYSKKDNRFR